MIRVRMRVSSKDGDFAVVVCAENLQRAAVSTKGCFPGSSVQIVFPIEPEQFFVGDPHRGEHVGLEVEEVRHSREGAVEIME
jgi:hypothetical protein